MEVMSVCRFAVIWYQCLNCRTNFHKIRYARLTAIIKSGLRKAMNGLFHVSHELTADSVEFRP
jgi:hypothetical protein